MTALVRLTIARFDKAWGETAKKQLRFAQALALTRTAQRVQADITAKLPVIFNNPVQRTLNSIYVVPAKISAGDKMFATVLVKNLGGGIVAEKYLRAEIEGGVRHDKRLERALQARGIIRPGIFAVPWDESVLDAHGNMPGSLVKMILARLKSADAAKRQKGTVSKKVKVELLQNRLAVRQTGTDFFVAKKGGEPIGVFRVIAPRQGKTPPKIKGILRFVHQAAYRKRFDFKQLAEASADRHFATEMTKAFREAMQTAKG